MVTNNALFCHRHLRVKVKKHIHHSQRAVVDVDVVLKGVEDRRQGRAKTNRKGEQQLQIQNTLIFCNWAQQGDQGDGGGADGEKGNSGLIENICAVQNGCSSRA